MAETTYAKVKRQVWAEFDSVELSDTGKRKRQEIWDETLGYFFKRYGDTAAKKWKVARVRNYGMRAVKAIVKEAKEQAGGKPVGAKHLTDAADIVIPKFRKFCPVEVKPGSGNNAVAVQLHGLLCEIY